MRNHKYTLGRCHVNISRNRPQGDNALEVYYRLPPSPPPLAEYFVSFCVGAVVSDPPPPGEEGSRPTLHSSDPSEVVQEQILGRCLTKKERASKRGFEGFL